MSYQIKRFKNGVRYALIPLSGAKTVFLEVYFEAGSIHGKKPGIAHLLEHLFFSTYRNKNSHKKDCWRGMTSPQYMKFSGEVSLSELKQALLQLKEMVFDFKLQETSLAKEKHIVINELHHKLEKVSLRAFEETKKARFVKRSPSSRVFADEITYLHRITEKDIQNFYKDKFATDNCLIVIGLSPSKRVAANKLLKEFFEPIKKTTSKRQRISPAEYSGQKIILKKYPSQQLYLSISFPFHTFPHPKDFFAHMLFVDLLSGGKDSILMKTLRYDKGLVYRVHANIYPALSKNGNFRFFVLESYITPEFLIPAIQEIITIMKQFDAGVYKQLLQEKMRSGIEDLNTPSTLFRFASYLLLTLGRVKSPDSIKDMVRKISPQELNKIARRIFDLDHINIVALGNISLDIKEKIRVILK